MRALARWTSVVPLLGLLALAFTFNAKDLPVFILVPLAALLAGSVLAAVHHAEVVAHRVGEPFGSLILALAVTVIEVGLVITLMASGPDTETLARDTVFAAVMITVNGIAGLALFLAGLKHTVTHFNAEGSGAALATVATLTVLTLVLPTMTTSAEGGRYNGVQLVFAAVGSLVLWGLFVLNQTVRHRDFFLPVNRRGEVMELEHAEPPSRRTTWLSFALLIVSLAVVVGLAKVESKPIEELITAAGLPAAFVGVLIALLVLLPETLAAARNARRDRTQVSLNLAYGSAIASIGLTIPAIAIVTSVLDLPLELGLGPVHLALFALTMTVAVLTVVPGRATRLTGAVHLVILAAFVFLSAVP